MILSILFVNSGKPLAVQGSLTPRRCCRERLVLSRHSRSEAAVRDFDVVRIKDARQEFVWSSLRLLNQARYYPLDIALVSLSSLRHSSFDTDGCGCDGVFLVTETTGPKPAFCDVGSHQI